MEINNLKIKKALLNAKKLGFTFVLAATPITLVGCQRKISKPSIEKTIEQNKTNTYMGSVFAINKDLKKDVSNLEKALANDPEDEESRKYIMDNSKHILETYLLLLIKSSICDARDASVYDCENIIINFQSNKYDADRITASYGDELLLINDGKLKNLVYDYISVSRINQNTKYNQIRDIAVNAIEDSKEFIAKYELEVTEPDFVTSYFNKDLDGEINTKKLKK